MIDVTTNKPLHVWGDGSPWPWIVLPVSQLDQVRQLLDNHGIRYEVEDQVISFNDEPETAHIHLGRGTDAKAVQAILDGIR